MITYLFYFVQNQYKKWGESDIPMIYGLSFVSFMQMLNLFTLAIIALLLGLMKVEQLSGNVAFLISLTIFLLNYIYLFRIKGTKAILRRYEGQEKRFKSTRTLALIYVIITLVAFTSTFSFYLST